MTSVESEPSFDRAAFRKRPVDRLFAACVLGALVAYVGALVAMHYAEPDPDDDPRQGYLGVVSGDSEPSGMGGEADPATGTADRAGPRPVYVIGGGAPARGIEAVEPGSGETTTAGAKASRPLFVMGSGDRGGHHEQRRGAKLGFERVAAGLSLTQIGASLAMLDPDPTSAATLERWPPPPNHPPGPAGQTARP